MSKRVAPEVVTLEFFESANLPLAQSLLAIVTARVKKRVAQAMGNGGTVAKPKRRIGRPRTKSPSEPPYVPSGGANVVE